MTKPYKRILAPLPHTRGTPLAKCAADLLRLARLTYTRDGSPTWDVICKAARLEARAITRHMLFAAERIG